MKRLAILASVIVLATTAAGCGNSDGPANPLADIGPSAASMASPDGGGATLTTLGKGANRAPGGTTSGGGTISIVLIDSTDGVAHFGQRVTFKVSTTSTAYPWVTVKCSANGTQVYQASNGIFPTSLNQVFTLGPSPSWKGGDADCTATLENWDAYSKNGHITPLASTSFHVLG